ncbi:MAG: response regulator RpfG family c-di-GMP phosphodiesterase [Candidatus Azotimanducaceae bacterium]
MFFLLILYFFEFWRGFCFILSKTLHDALVYITVKTTILLLDDDKQMFKAINRLVRPLDAVVFSTASETSALETCIGYQPQIVIADLNRPDINVSDFLQTVSKVSPGIRKIVLTSFAELASTVDAINKGKINRFFTKPWDAAELRAAISEELDEYDKQQAHLFSFSVLGKKNEEMVEKVDFTTRLLNGTTQLLAASRHRASIDIMGQLMERRLPGAQQHTRQVAKTALAIANQLELTVEKREQITLAAELCQIGLLGLSDDLLTTPWSDMTEEQREAYSTYPHLGAQVLTTEVGENQVAEIVRHHRENNDGSGFPDNLVAGFIPIGAHIVRVAADYVATAQQLGPTVALYELTKDKREKYDPTVIHALTYLKKATLTDKRTKPTKSETPTCPWKKF